ncbi:uncharacterized protein LOC143499405 [Brachyhypopomus gauderio]|uniref:uncharacterized protein LOC143499405 n=1 Tax=Brachyhypopomus gauderio TaxID=698409 RepID=UPI0040426352
MLSRSLLFASLAIAFLATTTSAAPVEDKEPDENDFETEEAEEELSEEEEAGAGGQQATVVSKGPGQKLNGDSPAQTASVGSSGTVEGSNGSGEKPSPLSRPSSGTQGSTLSGQGTSGSVHSDTNSHGIPSQTSGSHVPPGPVPGPVTPGETGDSDPVPGPVAPGETSDSDPVPGPVAPGETGDSDPIPGPVAPGETGDSDPIPGPVGTAETSDSDPVSGPVAPTETSESAVLSSETQAHISDSEAVAAHRETSSYDNGESQTLHAGPQTETPGSKSIGEMSEIENNGIGQKQLTNRIEQGHTDFNHFIKETAPTDPTGVFHAIDTSSHMETTGVLDQSNHDFLVGLMGGIGGSSAPQLYTDITGVPADISHAPSTVIPTCLISIASSTGHMGIAFQRDSTAGLDPNPPARGVPAPGAPAVHSGPDRFSTGTGPGGSVQAAGTSDNGFQFGPIGDLIEGVDNNGADSPDTNGGGRFRPVADVHRGDASETGNHLGISHGPATQTDRVGRLHFEATVGPYTKLNTDGAVTGVNTQTNMAGLAGEPVTKGHTQTDITAMRDAVYSPVDPLAGQLGTTEQTLPAGGGGIGVTEVISNHTGSFFEAGLGHTGKEPNLLTIEKVQSKPLLPLQKPQRHTLVCVRRSSQLQRILLEPPHTLMSWLQLYLRGHSGVQVKLVLWDRHNQLPQQVNSTTHLVRVLKVQKMWNWRIPADFHMKPRVKFLRYRFQCTDQSTWQQDAQPTQSP